jgi:hypothetical protein
VKRVGVMTMKKIEDLPLRSTKASGTPAACTLQNRVRIPSSSSSCMSARPAASDPRGETRAHSRVVLRDGDGEEERDETLNWARMDRILTADPPRWVVTCFARTLVVVAGA